MLEIESKSQLEYISKKPYRAFDFLKHFEIYEKAFDLFDENESD